MSGKGIYIRFSNLLRIALSNPHGMLVAPSTSSPVYECPTPSICTKNSVFTLLVLSFSPSERALAIESTSSMKITLGLLALAILNNVFISFSLSPTYLLIKSDEETEKKVALHSVAQALAKNVLPVPGGPYNSIPFHGLIAP